MSVRTAGWAGNQGDTGRSPEPVLWGLQLTPGAGTAPSTTFYPSGDEGRPPHPWRAGLGQSAWYSASPGAFIGRGLSPVLQGDT